MLSEFSKSFSNKELLQVCNLRENNLEYPAQARGEIFNILGAKKMKGNWRVLSAVNAQISVI